MDARTHADMLLAWYDRHARVLPWRAPPGAALPDPYRVWLSEVMLQQTTVAAVIPCFQRFIGRWPDVMALAAAPEEEVMAAWAGLGYYARARRLIACARAVAADGGRFPDNEDALRALPGLGEYMAAAVAAIAFGRRAVVVDGNVERVVARLFAVAAPLPGGKRAIRTLTDTITPQTRAGDFAQAMMDLANSICLPRAPHCLICPLHSRCEGRQRGNPQAYPARAAKPPRPERRGQAFWIIRPGLMGDDVWLVRRKGAPGGAMLEGMRALPDDGWSARGDGHGMPPLAGPWQLAGGVRHIFTHFSLRLELMRYLGDDWASLPPEGEWWPLAKLAQAGLPTLFTKAAQLVEV